MSQWRPWEAIWGSCITTMSRRSPKIDVTESQHVTRRLSKRWGLFFSFGTVDGVEERVEVVFIRKGTDGGMAVLMRFDFGGWSYVRTNYWWR
jgi:hypothetical protein